MTFKIGFIGIMEGSPFAIEVAQGGLSENSQLPYWGETSTDVSAQITVTRSNLKVAPEAIGFQITDLSGWDTRGPESSAGYNPQVHDIYYFWDFGDAGRSFDKLQNVLPHQKDANRTRGPLASHVYGPGNYTVSCLMIEPSSGKSTTVTYRIGGPDADGPAVQDPNTVFSGDKTTYVDPDGDYSQAPVGAFGVATFSEAITRGYSVNAIQRIMLSAGKTHATGGNKIRGDREKHRNVYVCGAPGARPVLYQSEGTTAPIEFSVFTPADRRDAILTGFALRGTWNDRTEAYEPEVRGGWGVSNSDLPIDYLAIIDCEISGFDSLLNNVLPSHDTTGQFVLDCNFASWSTIGGFVQTGPTCFVGYRGNIIAHHPEALSGGNKGAHNEHGCIRHQASGPLDISQNDLFNQTGWFQNVPGYRTQQNCLRICQSGTFVPVVNIQDNTVEGGWDLISLGQQDSGVSSHLQNILCESNILVGGHMTTGGISLGYGGTTVRNNICILPDTPRISAIFDPSAMVRCQPALTTEDAKGTSVDVTVSQSQIDANRAAPVRIYSNTFVMLMSPSNYANTVQTPAVVGGYAPERFTDLIAVNNLLHAPNISPSMSAGPLDTAPIWQARMLGYRSTYERIDLQLTAAVAPGAAIQVNYPAGRKASDYLADTSQSIDSHVLFANKTTYGTSWLNAKDIVQPASIGVAFNDSEISITNLTGVPLQAGEVILILNARPNPPPRMDQYASPADFIATYAPLEGSPVLGAADHDLVALTDLTGAIRPAYRSKGAFEVSQG